jgi:hypothetical protein
MRESADPLQQVVAQIQERLIALERRPRSTSNAIGIPGRGFTTDDVMSLIKANLAEGHPAEVVAKNVAHMIKDDYPEPAIELQISPDNPRVATGGLYSQGRRISKFGFLF